ncbi:hypothetical protein RV15_GL001451 [Enterococcus silesiacus]|uniref:Uncharacterized protein n=1 Tax=Enterococcus silesiacus TaxID=332949 RepID=A0AA91GD52_9ENTE|nr:hypothetical protein RV15_GL001451 [Enterococcus silesiacus]
MINQQIEIVQQTENNREQSPEKDRGEQKQGGSRGDSSVLHS